MKKTFIVANWKSNKTALEARKWFQEISNSKLEVQGEEKIIICPPFTLLPYTKHNIQISNLSWHVGAQDISQFEAGAYTGAISGQQIKEFADYVIIGHSERRNNFGETDEMLFKKNELAKKNNLTTIFCVQGKETKIPANVNIVAYEPIDAIGTGHPDTPENADGVAAYFKANFKVSYVLYGGSVAGTNVGNFTKMSNIDGVLIGKASLDAQEFYKIIKNA